MTAPRRRRDLASVIVALNPHDHDFRAVLDAWAAQVGAGEYEVIVAHDGCRPSVQAEVAAHRLEHPSTPVRLVESRAPGRAASNNAGVRASRGDLVVFVADDFRPSAGLVAAHRLFHARIGCPAAGIGPGYFDASRRADPFARWLEDSGHIWGISFTTARLHWREDFFYVGNASMFRQVFDAAGGFDESFRYDLFDDWAFGERLRSAGVASRFVARAIAWHDHGVTLDERMVAARRMGEHAAECEHRLPIPPGWLAAVSRPPEEFDRAVREAERRAAGSPSIVDRQGVWAARLARASAQGYWSVRARSHERRSAG